MIYYFKKRNKKRNKKRFFAYCPKVSLVETGFEPGAFEFPTYQSNYLTRPNDFSYSDYLCMPVLLLHIIKGLTINYF